MAPDKIYIQPSTINELPRQNIIYTKRLSDTSIEYIRKDALLKWAREELGNTSILRGETIETLQKVIDKLCSI